MSTEQQQEVIVIQEEKDGSATIELPDSIPSPEPQHLSVTAPMKNFTLKKIS